RRPLLFSSFFFTAPATTQSYTLSLHDALPISVSGFPSRFIASIRHPRLCALALRYNVRWSFRLSVAFVSLASHHHVLHSVAACRSEEHTSELQSRRDVVFRLLLEKKTNSLMRY